MIPSTYSPQNGCNNCNYSFTRHDYDEADRVYCLRDMSRRPKCMSQLMDGEFVYPIGGEAWHAAHVEWEAWERTHNVAAYGRCDEWKPYKD